MSRALDELKHSLKAAQAELDAAKTARHHAAGDLQAAEDRHQRAARNVARHHRAIDAVNSLDLATIDAPEPEPESSDVASPKPAATAAPSPAPIATKHGTERAYRDGCRCDTCRAWKSEKNRQYRERRRLARAEPPESSIAASDSCAKPEPPQVSATAVGRLYATVTQLNESITKVVAPPAAPRSAVTTVGVTARCQDCTRAFTLSGRPLEQAAQMHEMKHGHIVDVLDGA